MSVTEVLGALGSWTIQLDDTVPDEILKKLGFFGHIVIMRGTVDPTQTSGATLLSKARYVGVLIDKDQRGRELTGDGMRRWLGDEDSKGPLLTTKVSFTNGSLTAWLTALLPSSIGLGSIHDPGGTLTNSFQFVTARKAIDTVLDAFNVESRVNGNGTIDVGTPAQLYATTPTTVVKARGAGADMDIVALDGDFQVQQSVRDYSTDVYLLGTTQDDGTIVNASATTPSVPYLDIRGNQVKVVRPISESGETSGTAAQRSQLQLNRFNRLTSAVRVTAENYQWRGTFVVGDNAYVFDPDNGIFDTTKEVFFRGEKLYPAIVRITAHTWQVTEAHTVLFRTQAGEYVDLTRWVQTETGSDELTVGDTPKSLVGSSNPVLDRSQSAPDDSIPNAPTSLGLVTSSTISTKGQNIASVTASWTAPAQNTDGSVVTDLSHYLVQWRPQFRAPIWNGILSPTTSAEIPNLTVGLIYDVRVAAVDLAGHIGAFTSVVSITAAPDTTPPVAPADPVVGSYLGQLRIEYAGTDNLGQPMASDTNRVDVHVSATTGFTPTVANRVSSLTPFAKGVAYADAPYGSTRFVKLVAYDHNQNPSATSAQVSGATVQVADGDVASLSVGKLTAGTMSADVVMAGRFATALTGARREVNAVGFQGWDASNNLTISLDGTNNLLTGIFKTALTGRRIEMGSAGATGLMSFIAPDGTVTFIRGRTESAGIEAIQFGIAGAGGDPSLPNSLWNRINYNNDSAGGGGTGYASYRANKHEFVYGKTSGFWHVLESANDVGGTTFDRLYIDKTHVVFHSDSFELWKDSGGKRLGIDTSFAYWDQGGQLRLFINDPDFTVYDGSANSRLRIQDSLADTGDVWFQWPTVAGRALFRGSWISGTDGISARLQLVNDYNFGAVIRFFSNSSGANSRFDFTNVLESGYVPLTASAFNVSSSQETKRDIADFGGDALATVRAATVRTYRRLGSESTEGEASPDGPEEIGLIAEEAPTQIVVPALDGTLAIDLYQYVALLHRAVQQLAEGNK